MTFNGCQNCGRDDYLYRTELAPRRYEVFPNIKRYAKLCWHCANGYLQLENLKDVEVVEYKPALFIPQEKPITESEDEYDF